VTAFPFTSISKAQLENLVRDRIERMADDSDLSWLRDVADDLSNVDVGVWRCPSGEVGCAEGMCDDDCNCCENAELWESPLEWEPKCMYCGRPALLVEIAGRFDYTPLVPFPFEDERG
jgi:hypothetical protein